MQDVNLPKENLLNAGGRMEGIEWRTSSIECLSNGGQPRSDGGKIVAKFAELSQVQRFLGSRACIKRRRGRKIAFKVASPRRGIREGLQSEFLNTFKKLGTRTPISRRNAEAIISRSQDPFFVSIRQEIVEIFEYCAL